jgi:RNA polymerase sigma factor (sigma-70 family)
MDTVLNINTLHSQASQGDQTAEEALFKLLTARFRYFAQHKIRERQDVEEIVQDALMTILKKYQSIDFKTSFSTWAHRVLINKILDFHKTKSGHLKKLEEIYKTGDSSSLWNKDNSLEQGLLDCLKQINAAYRRHARVLNLHYQGFKVEEICSKLQVTRTNLYSILSRARAMLETCLEKGDIGR